MENKYILPIILLFILVVTQTGAANPGENQACDNAGCHAYPSSLVNITTNIANVTMFNGDTVNITITWNAGSNDETIAVKWPGEVYNNSQFNLSPVLLYNGTDPTGTAVSNLTAQDIPPGDYIVRVYATIGSPNETDYKNITVTVLNRPPVADAGGPYTSFVYRLVTFNGSGSYDPDGNITNYTWDFGDGYTGYGVETSHRYNTAGTYTVNLTVTDDQGSIDTNSTLAKIMRRGSGGRTKVNVNLAPVADAGGPYNGIVNESVTFNGSGSNDPDGTITSYTWEFGDGYTGYGMETSHTYDTAGTYTVNLTVTDDQGSIDTNSTIAEIKESGDIEESGNLAPVADAGGPYNGTVNESVTFNGSGSYDPDGNITNYTWDFGDGCTGSGLVTNHAYDTAGTYTVNLTVTDNNGTSAVNSTWVLILDDEHPGRLGKECGNTNRHEMGNTHRHVSSASKADSKKAI